jgi:hypothetical protein
MVRLTLLNLYPKADAIGYPTLISILMVGAGSAFMT